MSWQPGIWEAQVAAGSTWTLISFNFGKLVRGKCVHMGLGL